jgi:hypothetical protein
LTSRRGSPSAAAEAGEEQSCRSHPGRGRCGPRTTAAVAAAGGGVVAVGADGGVAAAVGGAGADAGSDQTACRAGQTGLRPSTASVGACWEGDATLGACQGDASPSAAPYWGWKQPGKWKKVSTKYY